MSVNSLVYRLELQEMFAFFFSKTQFTFQVLLACIEESLCDKSFVLSVVIFRKLSTAAYNAELIK